jgi:DNA-binding transcriptional ArsR family regulator
VKPSPRVRHVGAAVLERLGAGSATISELAEPFGMSLTGMKKHVRLLEEAELVTTEKVGGVDDRTVRQHNPPSNPTGWRDGS